jgi:hypothetical protein
VGRTATLGHIWDGLKVFRWVGGDDGTVVIDIPMEPFPILPRRLMLSHIDFDSEVIQI